MAAFGACKPSCRLPSRTCERAAPPAQSSRLESHRTSTRRSSRSSCSPTRIAEQVSKTDTQANNTSTYTRSLRLSLKGKGRKRVVGGAGDMIRKGQTGCAPVKPHKDDHQKHKKCCVRAHPSNRADIALRLVLRPGRRVSPCHARHAEITDLRVPRAVQQHILEKGKRVRSAKTTLNSVHPANAEWGENQKLTRHARLEWKCEKRRRIVSRTNNNAATLPKNHTYSRWATFDAARCAMPAAMPRATNHIVASSNAVDVYAFSSDEPAQNSVTSAGEPSDDTRPTK
jgi:hypothetical protein